MQPPTVYYVYKYPSVTYKLSVIARGWHVCFTNDKKITIHLHLMYSSLPLENNLNLFMPRCHDIMQFCYDFGK